MSLLAQDDRLARRVGAVTLLVVGAAIGFVVFLADRIELSSHVRVRVYFHQTGGLHEGAPVIVGGRSIGRVERIAPARLPAGSAATRQDLGIVATLALDAADARRIARGGDVFVSGRGPLSARHLEIGPSPAPDGPSIADGDEIIGIDPPTLDRVLQRTWDNLNTTREFAQQVAPELDALRAQLRELAATLDGLAAGGRTLASDNVGVASLGVEVEGFFDEVRRLRDVALGGEPGFAKLAALLDRARTTVAKARVVLDTLGARARSLRASLEQLGDRIDRRGPAALAALELAIDRTRAAIAKVDPLLAHVAELGDRIARGEGSLGRLMQDPEFPEDAKALGKIMKRQPWRIFARPKDDKRH